jgi:hypothetical protein
MEEILTANERESLHGFENISLHPTATDSRSLASIRGSSFFGLMLAN